MKNRKRLGEYLLKPLPIIISAVLIASVCCTSGLGTLGLVAAAVMLPQGTAAVAREWLTPGKTLMQHTSSSESGDAKSQSVEAKIVPTVPEDIAALIEKYSVEFAKDTKAGNIKPITYGKKNATSTFGCVSVKNTTKTKSLNIEKVLAQTPDLQIDDITQPSVLIFHTHTSEGYEMIEREWYAKGYPGRSNNPALNIVRVGSEISKCLTEAGYTVIHDKVIHDDTYGTAYEHSGKSVQKYLEEYPSIQIVLDVHRDAIHLDSGDKIKPVAEINGKKAAQIMIITGAQEGKITEFPDWEQNLCFTLHLQKQCEQMYPGLMRPVLFSPRKYNMYMSHCNVLLEMGSDVNTLDEAVYSGRLVAQALAEMMKEYVK